MVNRDKYDFFQWQTIAMEKLATGLTEFCLFISLARNVVFLCIPERQFVYLRMTLAKFEAICANNDILH